MSVADPTHIPAVKDNRLLPPSAGALLHSTDESAIQFEASKPVHVCRYVGLLPSAPKLAPETEISLPTIVPMFVAIVLDSSTL